MKELLRELIQNSADNGQPVWDWEPETVAWEIQAYVDEFAEEIQAYVDEFADADTDQMVEAIKEIQEEMNNA